MGCKCGSVQLSQAVAVLGLVLSGLAIAPPLVSHYVTKEWSVVQPSLIFLQDLLEKEYQKQTITKTTLEDLKIFLDGFGENIEFTAVFVVVVASINICMDLFMLIGSCCNVSCLLLPWLILSMVKLIFLGCPSVIFFSLLGVYLFVQGLVIPSVLLASAPAILTLFSLIVWSMVLAAYTSMGTKTRQQEPDESETIEPLISDLGPVGRTSYNLGQYPQYYPPHTPAQQGGPISQPTAPPQSNTPETSQQFYPTLPVA